MCRGYIPCHITPEHCIFVIQLHFYINLYFTNKVSQLTWRMRNSNSPIQLEDRDGSGGEAHDREREL